MSCDKFRSFAFFTAVLCAASCLNLFAANPPVAEKKISFHQQIRPILQAQCAGCHHPRNPEGSYVVTEFSQLLKGGESETTAIIPGQPDKSYLVSLITPKGAEAEMPKAKAPLSQEQITLIRTWIQQGAVNDSPQKIEYRFTQDNPPTYSAPPVITSLDYSPDGKLLAVAGFHEVLLHAAEGNQLLGRLIGKSQRIESVRFSPDGKFLAVTGGTPAERGEIQIWDVAKQTLLKSFPLTYDTLYGASWSPD
ncbi:MAG: PD40 domain-containing protein, partial [Planctomycetaceae bacterium]|nr:PD40 domain-containing protein [Planctomycetaceae bacterium]